MDSPNRGRVYFPMDETSPLYSHSSGGPSVDLSEIMWAQTTLFISLIMLLLFWHLLTFSEKQQSHSLDVKHGWLLWRAHNDGTWRRCHGKSEIWYEDRICDWTTPNGEIRQSFLRRPEMPCYEQVYSQSLGLEKMKDINIQHPSSGCSRLLLNTVSLFSLGYFLRSGLHHFPQHSAQNFWSFREMICSH